MKILAWIFALMLMVAFGLRAEVATDSFPIRLALVTETGEAAVAADVLTAQLSGDPKIQLLERNQIEKVYREQGLSAANKDYLKLGRILGADGLLLMDVLRSPQATNLTVRLIAVKPGVVLTDGSFPWPLKDTMQWVESVAAGLNSFSPKLGLLARDAIPISVVNLRSAVQSAEAQETERQLKLLTIQRLSQERQFFVLERQKMQLLSEEKELKSDESAFWNGSYLLEGVVDQNGYSRETVTINGRLTPPEGGAPLLFEVGGSRTNLSEVINRLAAKVVELLKVNSTVKEWNAADEATQYFEEAKWALRWRVYSEAQAAADSAWALGKHDMDCAMVQVEAYKVPPDTGGYQEGEFTNPRSTNEVIQIVTEEVAPNRPWGLTWREQGSGGVKVVRYVSVGKYPDPKNIDSATHVLQLYYAFNQTLPPGEPKASSAWYRLGIEALTVASQVLQHFNFVPESQKPVADKLAELRALARSVAKLISQSPTVHDSFFVGDRIATHDELSHTIEEQPNLFKCELSWGCFWQEKPEDCIALYRELMSSPVFCYIHKDFWLRELQTARLTAWNEMDRKRIPAVWADFVGELNNSTNVFMRMEAKAVRFADAKDDQELTSSFGDLLDAFVDNRCAFMANNVEVLYLNWGVDDLVRAKTSGGIVTDTKESLQNRFRSEYLPKLAAKEAECGAIVSEKRNLPEFEKQKQFLKENKPFETPEFVLMFMAGFHDYSRSQALELQPLVAAYKSNLVAQSQSASGLEKGKLMGGIAQIGFLESNIKLILNPPAPPPPPTVAANQAPKPVLVAETPAAKPVFTNAPEVVTNVIEVRKFLAIPAEQLINLDSSERIQFAQVTITAHHWFEGRLVLDCEYEAGTRWQDEKGNTLGGRNVRGPAIAILDPVTERWEIIGCPRVDIAGGNYSYFYHRTALWHDELFTCDGGRLQKYDFPNRQWRILGISDGNNYELFAVNGHLYAANGSAIFEILDGGKNSRILASTRRRPPVSALDTEDLGAPTLFEGPGHSLRVGTKSKIFTWTGNDWHEDFSSPPTETQPEIFTDGVLFRRTGFLSASRQNGFISRRENGTYGTLDSQDEIHSLANETNVVNFCLGSGIRSGARGFPSPGMIAGQAPKPVWKMPANLLPNLPVALRQFDLYILEDSFAARALVSDRHEILQENVAGNDEFNAALLCFSHDFPLPQKLFLKFEPPDAKTAAWIFPTTNLLFFGSETPRSIFPVFRGGGGGSSGKAGVWLMPVSQIDAAVAAQKLIQFTVDEQVRNETEQFQKAFLTKYDRNHNGVLDPDEKQKAMDDPDYVKFMVNALRADRSQRGNQLTVTNTSSLSPLPHPSVP